MCMMMIYLFLLFLALCPHPFSTESLQFNTTTQVATNFLADLNVYMSERHYAPYRQLLDSIDPQLARTDSDRLCLELLNYTLLNPFRHEWTAKLLDSSGSLFAPGLMSGTYTSFGDFEGCLSVAGDHTLEQNGMEDKVRGKHCFVTTRLPNNVTRELDYRYANLLPHSGSHYSWPAIVAKRWTEIDVKYSIAHSICIPAVCKARFIREIILDVYKPLNKLNVDVQFCQTQDSIQSKLTHWSSAHILVISILGSVCLLVAVGTVLDGCSRSSENEMNKSAANRSLAHRLLVSFSLLVNVRDLFNVERSKRPTYEWLDGFRCMLTLLVLLAHVSVNQSVLQFIPLLPLAHFPDDIIKQSTMFASKYLVNSSYTVKSFFMISGFLLSVNFVQRKRLHSFGRYLTARWLRYTPTLLGYSAICVAFGLLGYGPLFHPKLIEPYVRPCVDHLWMQLLYINNWFDYRYSCGFQTWYISADLQLYLLAYIVLMLLYRQKVLCATLVCGLFIVSSYLISLFIFAAGIQGVPAFVQVIYPQLLTASRGMRIFWMSIHNHFGAYFGGVLIGICVGKGIVVSLSESTIRILWRTTLISMFLVPHLFPWFLKSDETKSIYDLYESQSWFDAIGMACYHTVWLLVLGWFIYMASTYRTQLESHRSFRFLCAPMWAPFARLCFCVYLMHVPLNWLNVHSARYPQMRDPFGVTQFVITTYLDTMIASIFLYTFFEAPFARVCQIFFSIYDESMKIPTQFSRKLSPDPSITLISTQIALDPNMNRNDSIQNELTLCTK